MQALFFCLILVSVLVRASIDGFCFYEDCTLRGHFLSHLNSFACVQKGSGVHRPVAAPSGWRFPHPPPSILFADDAKWGLLHLTWCLFKAVTHGRSQVLFPLFQSENLGHPKWLSPLWEAHSERRFGDSEAGSMLEQVAVELKQITWVPWRHREVASPPLYFFLWLLEERNSKTINIKIRIFKLG